MFVEFDKDEGGSHRVRPQSRGLKGEDTRKKGKLVTKKKFSLVLKYTKKVTNNTSNLSPNLKNREIIIFLGKASLTSGLNVSLFFTFFEDMDPQTTDPSS